MNQIFKKINKDFLISALLFFFVLSIFLFTLAPTITPEDSGELVTAAYTLGIAHPPGFPLYTILGKIFTFIPLGTIAWRVNLMSAFFGALTISLLYLVTYKISKDRLISIATSLLLAFSATFWSQSVIAEVYTLNTFLIALLILILLKWQDNTKDKYLLWFSFLYGLTLTNHTTTILIAPAFTIFIIFVDRAILKKWKLILKMFLLFLVGLSVYFYLPLRALFFEAELNWGPIRSWSDVWKHISRAQYNDLKPFENYHAKTGVLISFLLELYQQFFLPTLILAAGGASYLWKKNKSIFYLTFGIFILNSVGIIYLRKFGWNLGIEYTYRVYYLPVYMVIMIWLAVVLSYFLEIFSRALKSLSQQMMSFIKVAFYLVVLILPTSFLLANYENNDLSDYWFVYDFNTNLLNSLEPNSIYFFSYDGSLQGDTEIFSILYLKKVENVRPDVSVISEQQFFYKDVRLGLPKEYFKLGFEPKRKEVLKLVLQSGEDFDRPIYTNFAITQNFFDLNLYSLSNGYVFKIFKNIEEAYDYRDKIPSLMPIREIELQPGFVDYGTSGLMSHYYYNLAHYYLIKGERQESHEFLLKAFDLDTAPFNHEYTRFLEYRKDWLDLSAN